VFSGRPGRVRCAWAGPRALVGAEVVEVVEVVEQVEVLVVGQRRGVGGRRFPEPVAGGAGPRRAVRPGRVRPGSVRPAVVRGIGGRDRASAAPGARLGRRRATCCVDSGPGAVLGPRTGPVRGHLEVHQVRRVGRRCAGLEHPPGRQVGEQIRDR
jgi:hypothetical protein